VGVQDVAIERHVQHLFHDDRFDEAGNLGIRAGLDRIEGVQIRGYGGVFEFDRVLHRTPQALYGSVQVLKQFGS
jgi:hypothetical protein